MGHRPINIPSRLDSLEVVRIDIKLFDLVVGVSLFSIAFESSLRWILEVLYGAELIIDFELAAVCWDQPFIETHPRRGGKLVSESCLQVGVLELDVWSVVTVDNTVVTLRKESSDVGVELGGCVAFLGEMEGCFQLFLVGDPIGVDCGRHCKCINLIFYPDFLMLSDRI